MINAICIFIVVYWFSSSLKKHSDEIEDKIERINLAAEAREELSEAKMLSDYYEIYDECVKIGADPFEWEDFKKRRIQKYSKYLAY